MIIDLQYQKPHAVVRREKGDSRFYTDSTFLYHVKKKLIEMGHDVIKKRAWKDGNLVDDDLQWIRSREPRQARSFALWWGNHQTYEAVEDWNEKGEVRLQAMWDLSVQP